jgi:hypothetical protein
MIGIFLLLAMAIGIGICCCNPSYCTQCPAAASFKVVISGVGASTVIGCPGANCTSINGTYILVGGVAGTSGCYFAIYGLNSLLCDGGFGEPAGFGIIAIGYDGTNTHINVGFSFPAGVAIGYSWTRSGPPNCHAATLGTLTVPSSGFAPAGCDVSGASATITSLYT